MILISVEALLATVRPEEVSLNHPVGNRTHGLPAQCLNQLRYCIPPPQLNVL